MDTGQVENAIQIAWSPTSDHSIKAQAIEYLNQLRNNPDAWQVCLPMFTNSPPASEQVRLFCLEVLCNSVQALQLQTQPLEYMRATLMEYVQQYYGEGSAGSPDSAFMQNKLAQALTQLFAGLYTNSWQSFFDDFLLLSKNGANVAGSILYFRILGTVHDEIADVLLARSSEATKQNVNLKDLIRQRDASKIATFWQELLSRWRQGVNFQVLQMCLRTISKWVSWTDIGLIVNQTTLNALLEMAGQQNIDTAEATSLRDGAIEAFTEIAYKRMRPAEKIQLFRAMSLGTVVGGLIESPPLREYRNTPKYDTDFAEVVAKLVNNVVRDIVVILDSADAPNETKQEANEILQTFVPFLLRFFSDEYDEVCSMVIDGLSDILTLFRRLVKDKSGAFPAEYASLLPTILQAIINKMKYDETASFEEYDSDGDEDQAEFLDLRKRLNILQQQIIAVDENLVTMTVSELIKQTFQGVSSGNSNLDWRDVELALYQMHIFGDYAFKQTIKNSRPTQPTLASEQMSLMLVEMMASKVGTMDHPAVQLQFSHNLVKFTLFFNTSTQWIPNALECFVTYSHSPHTKVRLTSWAHFLRFTRPLRNNLGEVAQTVIQAMSDLLAINAVIPSDRPVDDSDESGSEGSLEDTTFSSQLYLFEAIGCIASAGSAPAENKLLYVQSIDNPIFLDMEKHLPAAKGGDERAIMQIHHDMMALGNLANGFTNWMPGQKAGEPPPHQIQEEFVRCGEAILVALESLNASIHIRHAARFTFTRLLGGMGVQMFPQLPRWIEGLLSRKSGKEETHFFIRLLSQVIFAFKQDISSILDAVLTPLFQRVFEKLSEPITGTDDEVHLKELRREFLAFILYCLNYNLGAVFISSTNQPIFENVISAVEHFARDPSDVTTARSAFSVMRVMTATWGGPDIHPLLSSSSSSSKNPQQPPNSPISPNLSPAPEIPGFDIFAVSRFSPLSWAIPSTPGFKVSDAGGRMLVHEIAVLQQEILKKNGNMYVERLREELGSMGAPAADVDVYVGKLGGDKRGFQEFLVGFLGRGR